jgi:hypothetical protein
MGGSSSTANVTTNITNKFVNQSDLNILNQITNKTVINAIIKQVQACSASIFQGQTIIIKDIVAKGDINISIGQQINSGLSFSCLQQASVKNDISSSISSQLYQQLTSTLTAQILQTLQQYAKAQSSAGWAAIGSSSSDSNTNTIVNNYTENKVDVNLKNIISFFTDVHINSETLQSCASQVTQDQYITVQNINGGAAINIPITQTAGTNTFTKCMQNNTFINTIWTNAANSVGIKVINDSNVSVTTKSTSEAVSEAVSEGIASVFNAIANLFKNLLTSIWTMMAGGSSVSCSSCCSIVIVVIIIVVIMKLVKKQ